MKKFLTCRGFGYLSLFLAVSLWCVNGSATPPRLSLLTVSSSGGNEILEATVHVAFGQETYECLGGITPGQLSMLICGDQRQAQVEFQIFNDGKNAALAAYQSGRQQGYLFLMVKQEDSYTVMNAPVVLTPGFGSLKAFNTYIMEPMKNDFTEAQVFEYLPQLMGLESSNEVSISILRDRIANKEHLKFAPERELPATDEPEAVEMEHEVIVEEAAEPETVSPAIPEVQEGEPSETTTIRVIRGGTEIEEVEVPRSFESTGPFGNSIPRRSEIRNPHGYNLRNMSLEEIRELERRGLIYRVDD